MILGSRIKTFGVVYRVPSNITLGWSDKGLNRESLTKMAVSRPKISCSLLGIATSKHFNVYCLFSVTKELYNKRRMCGDGYSMAVMSDHRSTA